MTACTGKDCKNDATCVPKLRVPAKGYSLVRHSALGLILDLPLCATCFKAMTIEGFIGENDNLKKTVTAAMTAQGKVEPDFDRAWLEVTHLNSPEYARMQRAQVQGRPH